MEVVASMHDFHVPYHDKKVVNASLKLMKHIAPMKLILHEVLDWYALSKFNKDPERRLHLQEELNEAKALLKRIRKDLPKTEIIILASNHQARLEKYLNSKAEELRYLDCMRYENLLGLPQLDIHFKPYYHFRKILWKHGDIVRKFSAYTAKAERDKEGCFGCSGHTHRLGIHYHTLRGGEYMWIEGGCQCKTKNIEYIDGTANWQNGLSMIMFKDHSTKYQPKGIPIIDSEILWGKHLFKG